jgi:hypothetical protein
MSTVLRIACVAVLVACLPKLGSALLLLSVAVGLL